MRSKQAENPTALAGYLARRAAAYIVDVAALAAGVVVTQGALVLVGAGLPATASGWQVEAWVLATVSIPIWLYFIVLECRAGWTLGKRLLGLRVENTSGGRLSWGQAVLRTGLKLLPWELTHLTLLLPVPMWADPNTGFRPGLIIVYALLGLYLATAALTPRRQTVPDLIARTIVR
jgi:uncharacterized RDD family membrane protein YckC